MKSAVVLTTIHVPDLLDGYFDNFQTYGHLDDVTVYVIPDRKTPREANYCIQSLRKRGLHIEFPDISKQEDFLKKVGLPRDFFPYDSDQRRNIGYLLALAGGCDFLISIDDDNYCWSAYDFIGAHQSCTKDSFGLATSTPWINPCDNLVNGSGPVGFQRGFPYFVRSSYSGYKVNCSAPSRIRANMGLWLGDPDIDALSWISHPATKVTGSLSGRDGVVLTAQSWMPINSQNTSVSRECIPAYLFLPAGRFGDIFQGYFLQACLKSQGYTCRFGSPIVEHRRNSHNHLRDVEDEIPWIRRLELLLPDLITFRPSESSILDAYRSLADLEPLWRSRMLQWTRACERIGV